MIFLNPIEGKNVFADGNTIYIEENGEPVGFFESDDLDPDQEQELASIFAHRYNQFPALLEALRVLALALSNDVATVDDLLEALRVSALATSRDAGTLDNEWAAALAIAVATLTEADGGAE